LMIELLLLFILGSVAEGLPIPQGAIATVGTGSRPLATDASPPSIHRKIADLERQLEQTRVALEKAKKLTNSAEATHIHISGKQLGSKAAKEVATKAAEPPPLHVFTPNYKLSDDVKTAQVHGHLILGPHGTKPSVHSPITSSTTSESSHGSKMDDEALLKMAWPEPASASHETRSEGEDLSILLSTEEGVLSGDADADLEAQDTGYMQQLQANRAVKQVMQLQQLEMMRMQQNPQADSHLDFQPRSFGAAPVMTTTTQLPIAQGPAASAYTLPAMSQGSYIPQNNMFRGVPGQYSPVQMAPSMAQSAGRIPDAQMMFQMQSATLGAPQMGSRLPTAPSVLKSMAEQSLESKLQDRVRGVGGMSPREMRQLRFMHGDFEPPLH